MADLIPWHADPVVNANLDLLRVEIHKMAEHRAMSGDNVTLVKMYEGFQPDMMSADSIHPNALGDKHMANQWLEAMRSDGLFVNTGNTTKVRVQAESGVLSGNMKAGHDTTGYVATYYATDYQNDYVTLDFTVDYAGVYRVLGRIKGTSSESDSLFFKLLPGGQIVNWTIPATGEYVPDYVGGVSRHYVYLQPGTHSARVYSRRLDARVDWLEFQYLGADPNGDVDGDGIFNQEDLYPNDGRKT